MKRSILSLLCLYMTALALGPAAHAFRKAAFLSGEEIMEMVKENHAAETEAAQIKMVTMDNEGNTQIREFISLISRNDHGRYDYLIRFLAPADVAGTGLLTVEGADGKSHQYLFLPALKKAREITGNSRSGSFMGSDFSFEDLRREDTREHVYHRLLPSEIDGKEVYSVMSAPDGADIENRKGYANRILAIDKDSFNILQIEFFDKNQNLLKSFRGHDYDSADVEGLSERPRRAIMTNNQKGTTTIMTLVKSRLNAPLPVSLFTVDSLENWGPEQEKQLTAIFSE